VSANLKYKQDLTRKDFKHIYDSYFDAIRNYIYYRSGNAENATDIAQETFIKVWEKQFKYDSKTTKSLLYKISSGIFIDKIRKQKTESEFLKEIKFSFVEGEFEDKIEQEELKQKYEKILANLPEKQRLVFLMSRKDKLKYKEIAERLAISQKAVEKRMSLALNTIKQAIP